MNCSSEKKFVESCSQEKHVCVFSAFKLHDYLGWFLQSLI